MLNFVNKIALPVALFGAINYGLIGLIGLDLISYLNDGMLIRIAYIIIGVGGVMVAAGIATKK